MEKNLGEKGRSLADHDREEHLVRHARLTTIAMLNECAAFRALRKIFRR